VEGQISFPLQQARTRRFSLGAPRSFTVSPRGERTVFLRSPAGDDPNNSLWVYDSEARSEREVASATIVLGGAHEQLSPEERARRERSRELAGGIVGYACDEAVEHAAFTLGGRLWWASLEAPAAGGPGSGTGPGAGHAGAAPGVLGELPSPGQVVDPRPSPDGRWVAFLSGARLCIVGTRPPGGRAPEGDESFGVLAGEEEPEVTWGAAEFVAAEEMGRERGYWWSPDGTALLAARVDNGPVATWWTADPSQPGAAPEAHRYPQAGTADAEVTLWHLEVPGPLAVAAPGEAGRRQVSWDSGRYPYLVAVHWGKGGPPLLLVEQRDHKRCAVLTLNLADLTTSVVTEAADAAWVSWPRGVPAWTDAGKLVWGLADGSTSRLTVDGTPVTPEGLQVREVTHVGRSIVFTASSKPEVVEAWQWSAEGGLRQLTDVGGVSRAIGDGPTRVVLSASMAWAGTRAVVQSDGTEPHTLRSLAEVPPVEPHVRFMYAGERGLSAGVLFPRQHSGAKLPVIMWPYGGPGFQRVMAARSSWLEAQWIADQGFAVVVADGRGTPGRGPAFEREVYLDLAGPVLEDQVGALLAVARAVPGLDLERVGIRGWSFGGYLSALAVLARPDVFHAAFAGAPVTDWRLYDTYYTEKYLGHPDDHPEAYERSSLVPLARNLARPLVIVHGLADDNVYAAHSLELSRALLAAGRRHEVLPLPGITHVASRDDIAEKLLQYEVEFFRRALGA